MIRHMSLPAHEPDHAAEVLAESMEGRSFPFVPLGGATSGDEHRTLIEVYLEEFTA